jgi:general secretion pathway protein L
MITTLVMVGGDRPLSWIRLSGQQTTHGSDTASLPPLAPEEEAETIAVLPGEAVALHWVDLPELAPAQAMAAARLLAADVSAGPVDGLHVALGPVESDGGRVLALVDMEVMEGWLAQLAAAGIVAERLVPAPMLLPVPESGVAVRADAPVWQVRGPRLAFAAEPGLAQMLIGDAPVTSIDEATWRAGLAARLAAPMLNLRQGRFSLVERWQPDVPRLKRLALAGLALFAVLLATEIAATWRFMVVADLAEARLEESARQILPRGTVVTDAKAQVAARGSQLGGAGFAGVTGPLLAVLRDLPGVTVQSMEFTPPTGLVVTMSVPAPAERDAITAAMAAAGAEAEFGVAGETDGVPRIELRIQAP